MLKFFKKYNVEIACYSCIILLLVSMICCTFDFKSKDITYADYNDLVNDPNAIVNFNQISNEIGIQHDGTIGSSGFNNHGTTYFPSTLNSSHYYLVKFYYVMNSGNVSLALFSQGYNDVIFSSDNDGYSVITGWSTISLFRVYGTANSYYDFTAYISVIDLDVMFGSENIPTLSHCKNLFVADYYAYTLSTPLSFGTIQAYTNGVNAYASSVKTVINNSNFVNSMYGGVFGTDYASTLSLGSNGLSLLMNQSNTSVTYNCCCLPFNSSLPIGTSITIKCKSFLTNSASSDSGILYVGLFDSIGNMQQLGSLYVNPYSSSADGVYSSFTIDLPFSTDKIYFYCPRTQWVIFYDAEVVYYYTDLDTLRQVTYNDGYNNALSNYVENASGYNIIYQKGWQDGVEASNDYTFSGLITAAVDTPLKAFTTMFDFDILGVNMKTFYLSLFTLCMIISVIRLVL